jgi:hypothetical protein
VDIPKGNGKVRTLQIPCIRDRVVQGALKLILEAIFEADFCPNSYGFRPKRSPHRALAANIYLNEVADDIVITVSGHHTKRCWAERARQRLQEQIAPLGVELNLEKTRVVNTLARFATTWR